MKRDVSPQALLMVQEPVQERVRQMDAQGIDVEALSINPYWYEAERGLARQIIKIQNEKLAEICATPGLSDADRAAILGNTASTLLGIASS